MNKLLTCLIFLFLLWGCSQAMPPAEDLEERPQAKGGSADKEDHKAEEDPPLESLPSLISLEDSDEQDLSLSFHEEEQLFLLAIPSDYQTSLFPFNLNLPPGYRAYLQGKELSETFSINREEWEDNEEGRLILTIVNEKEVSTEYILQRSVIYDLTLDPSFLKGESFEEELYNTWEDAHIHAVLEYQKTIEISLGVNSDIPPSLLTLSALRGDTPHPQEILLESPDRIVFNQPGRYTINLSLNEEALENQKVQFSDDAETTLLVQILPNLPSQRFRTVLTSSGAISDSAFDQYGMMNPTHYAVLDRKKFDFSYQLIESFHGVHLFVNLEDVKLSGKAFDFAPFTKLIKVDLVSANLESGIFDFSNSTGLKIVYLQYEVSSRIKEIKLPQRGSLKKLTILGTSYHRFEEGEQEALLKQYPPLLTSLDIQGETNLEQLDLKYNYGLEEIKYPPHWNSLTHLWFKHILIDDLDLSTAPLLRRIEMKSLPRLTGENLTASANTGKDVVILPNYFYGYYLDSQFVPSFLELNEVLGHTVKIVVFEDNERSGTYEDGKYIPASQ